MIYIYKVIKVFYFNLITLRDIALDLNKYNRLGTYVTVTHYDFFIISIFHQITKGNMNSIFRA